MTGNVYAIDAATGREIWTTHVEDHPLVRLTGSPTLYDGRLYVPVSSYEESQSLGGTPGYVCCTFRGSLVALDAATGRQIWKSYMIPGEPARTTLPDGTAVFGPAGGAIWAAPTIDPRRRAIYLGVGNSYSGPQAETTDAVVALDLDTGRVRWAQPVTPDDLYGCRPGMPNCNPTRGPDYDFGSSPALVTTADGKDLIVIGQKSGVAYAMDPDRNGAVIWQYAAGRGSALGGIEWGLATDGAHAYIPVSDIVLPDPGGLHAVDLKTGARAWFTPPPPLLCGAARRGCNGAQSAAVTVIPGVVFSGSNDGGLRAYAAKDGVVIWTFDTNRTFRTVNGVEANGGSIIGPAPTVAGGMLFANSGYGAFGSRYGNVLLAFGVDRAQEGATPPSP